MFKQRIGITQKVLQHPKYYEVMDCLDTNWAKLLTSLEILPVPLPLLPPIFVKEMWADFKLDGLILSGGNTIQKYSTTSDCITSISAERDEFEGSLIREAISTRTPILGVCRGLQIINVYFGGRLMRIDGHVGSRHKLIVNEAKSSLVFPSEVNSYHDFSVPADCLGNDLIALAFDSENNVEALCHNKHKIMGIMWHPERDEILCKNDHQLIKGHFMI